MSKRLQILVPHYKLPQEEMTNLLDMIYVQRGINFDDIGVIIANDGDLSVIDEEFLNYYRQKFDVEYHILPHAGVSATRNRLIDLATADFIMFCDDDDTFLSNRSLKILLDCTETHKSANVLRSRYKYEVRYGNETVLNDAGETEMYSNLHGMLLRREFLVKNNIRFYERINVHEDSVFNILLGSHLHYENQEEIIINSQTYIYCHNDNSICKYNSDDKFDFVVRTTDVLINSRYELFKDLISRSQFNLLQTNIVNQSIVLYRFLKRLELTQPLDPTYVTPIFIHTALCFKRLLTITQPTLSMVSNEDFNNVATNLLVEESFNIPNNDYVKDFYRLVNYVNGLSYDDDPIVKWVKDPLTGEPSYNQTDVAHFIKTHNLSTDSNTSLSELYYSRGVDYDANNNGEEQNKMESELDSIIDKFSHTKNAADINTMIDEYAERAGYKTIDV
jgi:glycosyltransferase involved in cell wall biosynthesis